MSRHIRSRSGIALLSVMILLGLLIGAVPAGGADPVQVPFGVWAGEPGGPEQEGDYSILAIDPGVPGTQHFFYYNKIAGSPESPCAGMPLLVLGTVSIDGDAVLLNGDLRCDVTGDVWFQLIDFAFVYDPVADTMTIAGDPEYLPLERKCWPGSADITGTAGDDTLDGTDGDDVIDGRGGDDIINGLGGVDILCGGRGRDTIRGHDGIDIIVGGGAKDTIFGGEGSDGVLGWAGNDRVFTGPGHDSFVGGGGMDLLKAGYGNDYAYGSGKKDWLYGNADDDTLFGDGGLDIVNGGRGTDTCDGGDGEAVALCEA